MKTIYSILIFLALLLPASAQQIITATVTITNSTANGQTITVNGTLRTWTNNVTSAQNQIQIATNIIQSWTNLFYAFAAVPQSGVNLSASSTNKVLWQSFPGLPLTVSISTNWATLAFSTNTISSTNAGVVRFPRSTVGFYEQTNAENGLIDYLNDSKMTNIINPSSFAFSSFLHLNDLLSASNFLYLVDFTNSVNSTNFTLAAFHSATNYTDTAWLSNSNYTWSVTHLLDTASQYPVEYFQPACELLTNLCALGTLQGLSYIQAGTGNIKLDNTNGVNRLYAYESDSGSAFLLNYEDGQPFLNADASHNLYLEDHDGNNRLQIDNAGNTVIRSGSGHAGITLGQYNDTVITLKPNTFNNSTWPAIAIGTVTNFLSDAPNIGSGETTVNQFDIPANTFTNVADSMTRTIGLTITTSGSYEVKIYFAGDTILDTGTFTVASTAKMQFTATCSIDAFASPTSGSFRSVASGLGQGTVPTVFVNTSSGNAIDFTSANQCKLGIKGPGDNDITVTIDGVILAPSTVWGGLQ